MLALQFQYQQILKIPPRKYFKGINKYVVDLDLFDLYTSLISMWPEKQEEM